MGRQLYNLGWFPEGGAVDTLDKYFSLYVFELELYHLEWLLSVPGCWFGLPISAWGVLPLTIAAYASSLTQPEESWSFFVTICVPTAALTLVLWLYALSKGKPGSVYMMTKYLILPLIVGPPIATMYLLPTGYAPLCFVVCAWLASEVVVHGIKCSALRGRPVISMATQLSGVHRQLSCLQTILGHGETVFHSFPSGDSCGATVFSATLYLLGCKNPLVYLAPCLTSSFGRMYFHAHHLLDVTVGNLIGLIVTIWIDARMGMFTFTIYHSIVFMVVFLIFFTGVKKLLPLELPEKFNIDGIYGPKKA